MTSASRLVRSSRIVSIKAYKADAPVAFQPQYRAPAQTTNALAIAALICGVAQFAVGITFIPAIVLGHIARSQIRKTGEQGDGMALAGLILGYIGAVLFVVLLVVVIAFWEHFSSSTLRTCTNCGPG
jgi:hypothetical protein